MGISKAKGMALAKKMRGANGRVIVMTGDGELQEGQIWESLQTTAYQKIKCPMSLSISIKFSPINPSENIIGLGDLANKFKTFGWDAQRCDGHDFTDLRTFSTRFKKVKDSAESTDCRYSQGKRRFFYGRAPGPKRRPGAV